MITEIEKEFRFESAHRLPNVDPTHKCYRIHGHSFRVTIAVRGTLDPKLGWVCDFADLSQAWAPLHEILDHRLLNEVPGLENPTSEHLAAFICTRIQMPRGATLHSITVHETCTSRCTVYP